MADLASTSSDQSQANIIEASQESLMENKNPNIENMDKKVMELQKKLTNVVSNNVGVGDSMPSGTPALRRNSEVDHETNTQVE
ncbi:hypothetical protein HAX54_020193, partial [Datura stramonium]|nr:hypothetical protein [Datura stramonium]